jgi:hypothetical protein
MTWLAVKRQKGGICVERTKFFVRRQLTDDSKVEHSRNRSVVYPAVVFVLTGQFYLFH